MTFKEFEKEVALSTENICREIFRRRGDSIRIKKEAVAVKNLEKIFRATLALANEKGFHVMSLRDLCAESGMSMGGLYAYFKNKEDLLTLIQEQGRAIVTRVMSDRLQGIEDPVLALERAVRTHLYLSETFYPWFFFSYMETRFFHADEGKKAIAGELQTETVFTDILTCGIRLGVFQVENPQLLASVIKAMVQDWYLKRWKYRQRKISVDTYGDFIISIINSYAMGRNTRGEHHDKP